MEKKTCDGRKLKHEVLTELRKRAVARVQSGESPEVVIRTMGFSRACIYNWLAMYRAGGWDALDARKRGGRPRKLKGPMIRWVYRVVVGSNPRQYKFPFALWTRGAIATLIYRRYGVRLSLNSVGRLLAQLGITPQKPLWRAYQQDPERVRRWVQEEYPAIAREAKRLGAEIWFGDESGLRSDYHAGTTWAPKGQTPVVRGTGARYRLNMLRVVSRRGRMRFMIEKGGWNAEGVCRFLRRLMVGSIKPIFLIWDGHPIHKSSKVAKTVRGYKGRLRVYGLPGYSPELNPSEGVWREVKAHRLGRAGVFSFLEMKSMALSALHPLARRPDKIRSFFPTKSTM
ncbi:MAG: IS630 family transposase [Treponemataceae bacterium]|nr:IS630 family transposase [Treponemataceae bacterium]